MCTCCERLTFSFVSRPFITKIEQHVFFVSMHMHIFCQPLVHLIFQTFDMIYNHIIKFLNMLQFTNGFHN